VVPFAVHVVPVDRWIAEENAKLALRGKRRVDGAYCPIELRHLARHRPDLGLCRVVPHLAERVVRDVVSADEAIHEVLVSRIAVLHDDIVDDRRESGISNERKRKRVDLIVAVRVGERHHGM
jgi:hypothetical protein